MADCCSGDITMVYSCSGAADVGEISDRVARRLRDDGFAKMSCLAGIGADLSGYVQTAKGADIVYTIDGCGTACAKKGLERIGVSPRAVILTDMGLEKGKCPAGDEVVNRIAAQIIGGATPPPADRDSASSGCGCGGTC